MPTPARTSLAEIVAAARGIVEIDGVDALTMQRVAQAVGVRAPSLYKRVKSRSDLIRLVVEETAHELTARLDAAAGSGDPQRDLRTIADSVRAFAHSQPATYALLFAPLPDASQAAPLALERAAAPVVRTAAAIAGQDHALEAARTIVAWAHGFISMELAGAFRMGGDVDLAFAFGVERLATALSLTADGTALPPAGRRHRRN